MKKIIYLILVLLLCNSLNSFTKNDFKEINLDELLEIVDKANDHIKDDNIMTTWCSPIVTKVHIEELPKERKNVHDFTIQYYNNQYKLNKNFTDIFTYKTELTYKDRKVILIIRKENIDKINSIIKPDSDVFLAAIFGMSFDCGKTIMLFVTNIKNDKFK